MITLLTILIIASQIEMVTEGLWFSVIIIIVMIYLYFKDHSILYQNIKIKLKRKFK